MPLLQQLLSAIAAAVALALGSPGATSAQPPVPAAAPADSAACAANTAAQLILVSITEQRARFCTGATLLRATPVTTGRLTDGLQTNPGTWTIQAKQNDRTLTGPGYSVFVHYWMPYDGDFGIHDATWQQFPFGGPQWTTQGSSGCVHMPLDVMAWLYSWAQPGATVTITP